MNEKQMIRVRDDIGMLFQESALFDSLTVADNVGYKLYEETDMPADQVRRRVEEVLGSSGWRIHRQNAFGALRRTAAAGGDRARHGRADRGCCYSMSRLPASIRLPPRPSTPRSSS